MIWFTSDWHLGHGRIIELTGRPFDTTREMNAWLVNEANRVTEPDDTLIFLGDVAMGTIAETLPLFAEIKTRMMLKPGNHDRCSPLYYESRPERATAWTARYEEVGLHVVDSTWFACNDFNAVLNHFPYTGDTYMEDRYIAARPIDKGEWLLHGHTHGLWRQNGRQIDVGVDAWGGRLVSQTMIAALIKDGPAMLDPLPWPDPSAPVPSSDE